jgi:hypothetical protein
MANENDRLEQMTLADMRRVRARLFDKLIAEPITDPGFRRPYEKLRHIVIKSEEFIQCLQGLVCAGDELCSLLKTSGELLKTEDKFVEGLSSIAFNDGSLQIDIADIIAAMNMPDAERLLHHQRREYEAAIQRQAIRLVVLLRQFPSMEAAHGLDIGIAQLKAAQLWAFLEGATARVAEGTDQVFHGKGIPEGVDDLISDALDQASDAAEIVNIMPVFRIISAILGFIQRKEKYEEGQQKTWADFEMNVFLASYFEWWTDGNGEQTIDGLVQECKQRFEADRKNVGEHFSILQDAVAQLEEFRRTLREYSKSVKP